MHMPVPTDAHRKLERLAGRWVGRERIHPSPMAPAGGEAVGRMRMEPALDGFAVLQDYAQDRGGAVTFRGHGIFRYDASAREYQLHWFDSLGQAPGLFTGTFDGDRLVLVQRTPQGRVRSTWDLAQPDAYRWLMEVSGDGAQWMPFMEGEYRRER